MRQRSRLSIASGLSTPFDCDELEHLASLEYDSANEVFDLEEHFENAIKSCSESEISNDSRISNEHSRDFIQ